MPRSGIFQEGITESKELTVSKVLSQKRIQGKIWIWGYTNYLHKELTWSSRSATYIQDGSSIQNVREYELRGRSLV